MHGNMPLDFRYSRARLNPEQPRPATVHVLRPHRSGGASAAVLPPVCSCVAPFERAASAAADEPFCIEAAPGDCAAVAPPVSAVPAAMTGAVIKPNTQTDADARKTRRYRSMFRVRLFRIVTARSAVISASRRPSWRPHVRRFQALRSSA